MSRSHADPVPRALDPAAASESGDYFTVPAAGLGGVSLVDEEDLFAGLPGLPQEELLEAVVGEGQHGAYALAANLSLPSLHHVAGFECWQEDEVEVADQEACRLVMELIYEVGYADSHAVRGLPQVALSAGSGLGRPADELVEVLAEALDSSEVVFAYLAGVGFGEPGKEGADAGIQGYGPSLGLAGAPMGPEGYSQVILSVVEG